MKRKAIVPMMTGSVGPEREHDHDGQQDGGNRQDGLEQAAEDLVDPAPEVPGEQPDEGAEHGGDRRCRRRNNQDGPGAEHDSGVDVAAEAIGAEPGIASG